MKSIFKKIILIFIIILTILNTTVTIYLINLWNIVKIDDLSKLYPEGNTTIYDKNGNLIANLSSIYTSYAPYETIPEVVINAFISIEDSRFFLHNGLDYEAILRSIIENIKNSNSKPTLLLHTCCALCFSSAFMQCKDYFDITVYFYNPNIYPLEEYNKRKEETRSTGGCSSR